MSAPLLIAEWEGDVLRPLLRFMKELNARLVVGERYRIDIIEERSERSHRAYFAAVNEAWMSLPEDKADLFPTAEHLRKYALVKTGYADHRSIVCASKAEAVRLAAFIKPMDAFAVVTVRDAVVNVWTAKSQSSHAMGKKDFLASQQAVRDLCAGLIGVTGQALANEGEAATIVTAASAPMRGDER